MTITKKKNITIKGVHNQFNKGESRVSLDLSESKLKEIPPGDRKHGDYEFRYNKYGVFNSSWQCGAHGFSCAHQPSGFPTYFNPHACCQWNSSCSIISGDCKKDCGTSAGLPNNQSVEVREDSQLSGSTIQYCQSSMGTKGGGGGGDLEKDGCKNNPNCENPIYQSCNITTRNQGSDQKISANNVIFLDNPSNLASMPAKDEGDFGIIQCDYNNNNFIIDESNENNGPYCELNDIFNKITSEDDKFNIIYRTEDEEKECPENYEYIIPETTDNLLTAYINTALVGNGNVKSFKSGSEISMAQACFEDINCHGYSIVNGGKDYKYIFIPNSPSPPPPPGSTDRRRNGKCYTKKQIIRLDNDKLPPGELPKCDEGGIYSNYIGENGIRDQTNLDKVVKNIEGYGIKFFEVDATGSSSNNHLTEKSYQSKNFADLLGDLCSYTEYNKDHCNGKDFCSYFESENPALKVMGLGGREVNICDEWANNLAGRSTIIPGNDYTEKTLVYGDKWGINSVPNQRVNPKAIFLEEVVEPVERSMQRYCDTIYEETNVNPGELNGNIDELCGCYKRESLKAYQTFTDSVNANIGYASLSDAIKSDYNHRPECWYTYCDKLSHNKLYNGSKKSFIPTVNFTDSPCSPGINGCVNVVDQIVNIDKESHGSVNINQSVDGLTQVNNCNILPSSSSDTGVELAPSSNRNMEDICNDYIYDLECEEESSAGKTKFERKTANYIGAPIDCFREYWKDGKNTCPILTPSPPTPPPPSPKWYNQNYKQWSVVVWVIIGLIGLLLILLGVVTIKRVRGSSDGGSSDGGSSSDGGGSNGSG